MPYTIVAIAIWRINTKDALTKSTTIPMRKLPYVVDTTPINQLNDAEPQIPDMNNGVARRVAAGPNIFANRTMFVGKIADVPSPAIAAPIVAKPSPTTIRKIPVSSVTAHIEINKLSDIRREMIDAIPRPSTRNEKKTTVRLMLRVGNDSE